LDPDYFKILRFEDLKDYGVVGTRPHVSRMIDAGRFPKAVELSANAIGWRLTDVKNWFDNLPVRQNPGLSDEARRNRSAALRAKWASGTRRRRTA
jgi:predicted DNA-binding transcriptional regulator AlpA